MLDPAWAVLWIALGAVPRAGPVGDGASEVVAVELEVFDAPEPGAFVTATLRKGDRVVVVGEPEEGWVAIQPPKGSFNWIDRAAIEVDEDDDRRGIVRVDRTVVRAGRVDARMPGPPRRDIPKGTKLRLLDQSPLILRQGTGRRAWLAVAPRSEDRRFVRAEGIRDPGGGHGPDPGPEDDFFRPAPRKVDRPVARIRVPLPEIDARFVAVAPEARGSGLPAALDAEIQAIEARHRRALCDPIDRWDLNPIRLDYRALLDRESSPAGQSALRDRLSRVDRQAKAARSVVAAEALLEKSRDLDRALVTTRGREAEAAPKASEPFDADGVLQESSRQVDGRRVWALIGAEGEACYLDIPPGLDLKASLDQRVGVRGSVRFDESLRARLIKVRDLERLGRSTLSGR